MLSLSALVVCLTAAAPAAPVPGDTVLIDFSAPWCGPCRQMDPVLARLAAAGYPVRKVNKDEDPQLASRFRVQGIPCFVLVANGREVDRHVGATSYEELEAMLKRHGVPTGSQVNQTRGQSPDAARRGTANPPKQPASPPRQEPLDPNLPARLIASSVRLKIDDPNGHSYGSGTIIDVRGDEALVLTCGHLFRDSQGKGHIGIDTFGAQPERGLPGRLVGYDLQSDVGLVSFRTSQPLVAAHVAPNGYSPRRGEPVINVGCNNGQDPTARQSRVTGIDKFLGPPNLQVAGQPVVGRSGGGLFNAEGLVIGVCNAADPADNEGLYAALPSIRAELDRRGLSDVNRQAKSAPATTLATNAGPSGTGVSPVNHRRDAGATGELASDTGKLANARTGIEPPARAIPAMARQMPAVATSDPMPVDPGRAATSNAALTRGGDINRLSGEERAVLGGLATSSQGAEVICIVRPRASAGGKSEIVVLDKASSAFLQQLAAEQRTQQTQQTSLEVARRPPATVPSPISVARPQTTAQTAPPRPAWQPHWLQMR